MTREAKQQIEPQQDKHSYDLDGLKRELWMKVLGLKPIVGQSEPRQSSSLGVAGHSEDSRPGGH